MSRSGYHRNGPAIQWADLLADIAQLEEEHRVSIYVHLWPYAPGRSNRRWMVRVDAKPIGSPYTSKHKCAHYEFWPNGRQQTLAACVMRCLLEVSALLSEEDAPR